MVPALTGRATTIGSKTAKDNRNDFCPAGVLARRADLRTDSRQRTQSSTLAHPKPLRSIGGPHDFAPRRQGLEGEEAAGARFHPAPQRRGVSAQDLAADAR